MFFKERCICLTHPVWTKRVFAKTKLLQLIITTALH